LNTSTAQQRQVYVDGASIPNPGFTACGIVIPNFIEIAKYLGPGSNQTAELHAIHEALLIAREGDSIFSDSLYAVRIITGQWRAKAHKNLVAEIRKLLRPGVHVEWIRGHAGHEWQERADALAKRAVINRQNFENVFPAGGVDAPAVNRPEGNSAPTTVKSTVGECL
jgi:ribonuclease HI